MSAGRLAPRLIHHGWDIPSPAYARQHRREIEAAPFDGTTLELRYGRGQVFAGERWDERTMKPELDALAAIGWERFGENYLMVHSASSMDWWDDEDWTTVLSNLRLLARAAAAGRLRGLCFDPEPYGKSPWTWREQERAGERSFADYQEVVRRRGREFFAAFQRELPDGRLLTFFLTSIVFDAAKRPDAPIVGCDRRGLETHAYGLLPAFLEGMLAAAAGRVEIFDGNELSYYYTQSEEFYRAYKAIHDDARCLLDPRLDRKYLAHLKVAQAIYVDELLGLRGPDRPAHRLTPAERLARLEQNVTHALAASDGLAWLYSEKMNWWERKLPEGVLEATETVRRAFSARDPGAPASLPRALPSPARP